MENVSNHKKESVKIIFTIIAVYAACLLFRCLEYFIIRTDETVFGEAFIHKLLGIAVCFLTLFLFRIKPKEAGFCLRRAPIKIFYGVMLGVFTFVIAYGVELIILAATGKEPHLEFYVTSYSVDGNVGNYTGFLFFLLCIVGNIINVIMEEGVFRGLFLNLAERKYRFYIAVIISSVLFGLWHLIAPLRSYLDGEGSLSGMFLTMLMLFFATGITGAKFCLLTKISGSLWLPMTDHFINNTLVNILHVVSMSGADELQTVRVAIVQAVSFIIVFIVFFKGKYYKKPTFESFKNASFRGEAE